MSASTDTPEQVEQAPSAEDAQAATASERFEAGTNLGRILHYAGMPVLITLLLVWLYFWVSGQELDAIEVRTLNTQTLTQEITRHITLTVLSTVIVIALAVPLGIFATRPGTKKYAPAIIGLGNAGQAIPSLGLLAIIFFVFQAIPVLPSTGRVPVVAALVAYSFLPILRNTMVGLEGVNRDVLEAGRGMGMSKRQVLRKIELPLAVPVMLAGVRTALILNVGTATLAFLFGAGGLGFIIFTGINLRRLPVVVTGAVLTAALALLVDYLGSLIEEWLRPKGL